MSLSIKVQKGTRPDRNICTRCSAAQTMLGPSEGADRIFCREIQTWIKAPVVECSSYAAKDQTSLRMLRELAYVLVDDGEGPRFISPAEQMGVPVRVRVRRRRNPRRTERATKETIQ